MKNITDIAGLIGVIAAEHDTEQILYWLRECAKRLGFPWLGIGARADNGELLMRHNHFPAGCYETYIRVFGEGNPIRQGALAAGLPFVWHAAEIAGQSNGQFDPHQFGVEWGISTAHRLEDGGKVIVSLGAAVAPRSEAHIWHLSGAALTLNSVAAFALESAGHFGDNQLTEQDMEILSYLSTPDGKSRKRVADRFGVTERKLSRMIASICKRLGVETEAQAFIKVAPVLNSKKWEKK